MRIYLQSANLSDFTELHASRKCLAKSTFTQTLKKEQSFLSLENTLQITTTERKKSFRDISKRGCRVIWRENIFPGRGDWRRVERLGKMFFLQCDAVSEASCCYDFIIRFGW